MYEIRSVGPMSGCEHIIWENSKGQCLSTFQWTDRVDVFCRTKPDLTKYDPEEGIDLESCDWDIFNYFTYDTSPYFFESHNATTRESATFRKVYKKVGAEGVKDFGWKVKSYAFKLRDELSVRELD